MCTVHTQNSHSSNIFTSSLPPRLAAALRVIVEEAMQASLLPNIQDHEYSHQVRNSGRSEPCSEETQGPQRSQSSFRTRVTGDYHAGRIFITIHWGETARQATGCSLIPYSFLLFVTQCLLHLKEGSSLYVEECSKAYIETKEVKTETCECNKRDFGTLWDIKCREESQLSLCDGVFILFTSSWLFEH